MPNLQGIVTLLDDHPGAVLCSFYVAIFLFGILLFVFVSADRLRKNPLRVGTVAFVVLMTAIWWLPYFQTRSLQMRQSDFIKSARSNTLSPAPISPSSSPANPFIPLTPSQLQSVEEQSRSTLAQIFGGIFLLIGLYFTWWRMEEAEASRDLTRKEAEESRAATQKQADDTASIAREGQITERFTRAIELLGSEKPEIRIGAIYAIERIARDSQRDHWPIMEVLTAYVRHRFALGSNVQHGLPDVDLQATITVLGRRTLSYESEEQRLDLSKLDLQSVDLRGLHLERANFTLSNLESAKLNGANLEGADFRGATLRKVEVRSTAGGVVFDAPNTRLGHARFQGADLDQAHLTGVHLEAAEFDEATLTKADLSGAFLQGATFANANLEEATLRDSHLDDADLRFAIGVTQDQIYSAHAQDYTKLPPDIVRRKRLEQGGGQEPE